MSRLVLVALAAVAIGLFVTPSGSPQRQAIIELACEYPTDGVLSWAEGHGITVNVREDC